MDVVAAKEPDRTAQLSETHFSIDIATVTEFRRGRVVVNAKSNDPISLIAQRPSDVNRKITPSSQQSDGLALVRCS
jgi:hypothetical protein